MGNATAETLYRIAGYSAADGRGWDALNAHIAADALAITAEMEKTPRALLDIGPLRSLDFQGDALPAVAAAFRRQLLKGLDSWGIAGTVESVLPVIGLAEVRLDPAEAGAFAREWLAGRDLQTFATDEAARASRFAALANRLHEAGDHRAAFRSAAAADRSSLAAHYGAEAAAIGDAGLAALRTGMLIAEDSLETEGREQDGAAAGRQRRRVHDAANLTDKPIQWESISCLS